MTEIDQTRAGRALLDAIASAGRFVEIRRRVGSKPGMTQAFYESGQLEFVASVASTWAMAGDVFVGAAPRVSRNGVGSAVGRVPALWVDADGPEAIERVASFDPWPNFAVRTSPTGLHAWWFLDEPIAPAVAETANRRLAAQLACDPRAVDRARILRVPSTLNWKTSPPGPVRCTRLALDERLTMEDVLRGVAELPVTETRPAAPPTRIRRDDLDQLRTIPAAEYVTALTGREVGRDGKAQCPFHSGGQERTPSLDTAHGSPELWRCHGCEPPPGKRVRGGDIYTFAGLLYGLDPRDEFPELRRRLARELLGAIEAAA